MSDPDADPEVTELLADLTRSLQELQREIEPDRRLRPPTPRELSQFTSEVAIPGLILLLQTNIKALQLLQRTFRLAQGKEPTGSGSTVPEVRNRAGQLSRATLSQLDNTLSEIQSAVEGRPEDDETRELLSEARDLRNRIRDEIAASDPDSDGDGDGTGGEGTDSSIGFDDDGRDPVDIDVEAELRTLKDDLDDDGDEDDRKGQADGSDDSSGQSPDGTDADNADSDGPSDEDDS